MQNTVHKSAVQGEDVLPQLRRHACISETYKKNFTIHRWEGQINVTKEDKGRGSVQLLPRVNEFSEGEDSIERLTVSLAGSLS
jgi:hypothetical protein